METKTLTLDCKDYDMSLMQVLAGNHDENLDVLSQAFHVPVLLRGHQVKVLEVKPEDEAAILEVLNKALDIIDERLELSTADMKYLCSLAKSGQLSQFSAANLKPVARTKTGRPIYPRTAGQARLTSAFEDSDIVFAVGAAGTGKTYLAVAWAVQQLKKENIERIVLTRPAVEAGESLGFLPGDMKEKVDPYLRPLYDALYDMLGQETVDRYLERGVIEIAPLAFMRGRTLNKAVVILDEAQNATKAQMKMFLTRMGQQCRMIVTGDVTQIDLIRRQDSGLVQAADLLKDIDGISVIRLTESDVVRHPLVAKIIAAYASVE
ncbi:PhoH family protein [Faecalibaculum rodentium]|jgi:phosphate starvation-inducible PhoH-like protein|uniref:PhoH family protein n=1 Tax=Faecalibaculum rodentium TaxID=1702221 RepID=UPI0023EF9EDF|nr:PhoH family protein [Faecalibaculum rodentium]